MNAKKIATLYQDVSDAICEHLEAVSRGQIRQPILVYSHQLGNYFRRCLKLNCAATAPVGLVLMLKAAVAKTVQAMA